MATLAHCQHEFTCPAFFFANQVWGLVRNEDGLSLTDKSNFAVGALLKPQVNPRSKFRRVLPTKEDNLKIINNALGSNTSAASYVEATAKFMQFDQLFMAIAAGLDKLAVDKAAQAREASVFLNGNAPNLDFFSGVFQSRSEMIRHNWERIRMLIGCMETHMRNAAEYHTFFADCSDVANCMTTHGLHLLRLLDKDRVRSHVKLSDLDVTSKIISEMLQSFRYYQERLAELRNRAYSTVSPIQYRTSAMLTDCHFLARCIVDAEIEGVILKKRQDLFVLDNTNTNIWKVRTMEGDELEVPAIFVELLPPGDEALESYGRLVTRMADIWSDVTKAAADYILWVTFVVVFNLNDSAAESNQVVSDDTKSSLLQLLLQIRSTLGSTWSEHEGLRKIEGLVANLVNRIDKNDATDTSSSLAIDKLSAIFTKLETFLNNWKKFVQFARISRAPEAFLVTDELKFERETCQSETKSSAEQEDFVKSRWRKKLSQMNRSWNEDRVWLKPEAEAETQTNGVSTISQEVDAIPELSVQAPLKCVLHAARIYADAKQRKKEAVPEIEKANKQSEAKITPPSDEKSVGYTVPSNSASTQTNRLPDEQRNKKKAHKQSQAKIAPLSDDKSVGCAVPTIAASTQTNGRGITPETKRKILSLAKVMTGFGSREVNAVVDQTSEQVESMQIDSTKSEEERKLIITAALDVAADVIVPIEEALARNIIDESRTKFRNTLNNNLMSIREAMGEGYVVMEMNMVSRTEQKVSYGVVTITTQKQRKSCKIKAVFNAKTGEKLSAKTAMDFGILDKEKNWVLDTLNDKKLSLADAIELNLVEVAQRDLSESDGDKAKVVKEKYEVYKVLDRRKNVFIGYEEATSNGLLNENTGDYYDGLLNQTLKLVDAINLKYVTAKLCDKSA